MKGLPTLLLLAALLTFLPLRSQSDTPITIINNQQHSAYLESLEGFRKTYQSLGPPAPCRVFRSIAPHAAEWRAHPPPIMVTLGSAMTRTAATNLPSTPILFMMVADPAHSQVLGPRICGVTLDTPYRKQLNAMKRILPGRKRIGLIYSPQDNNHNIPQAVEAANGLGLFLNLFPVSSPSEVPPLNRLNVEILWIIPDALICQPPIIKRFLMEGLQHGIPVVGISPQYVTAGALLALSCDYRDIGAQAAHMAMRVLRHPERPLPVVEPPRSAKLTLNRAVADRLGLTIPGEIWQEAHEVFGE